MSDTESRVRRVRRRARAKGFVVRTRAVNGEGRYLLYLPLLSDGMGLDALEVVVDQLPDMSTDLPRLPGYVVTEEGAR